MKSNPLECWCVDCDNIGTLAKKSGIGSVPFTVCNDCKDADMVVGPAGGVIVCHTHQTSANPYQEAWEKLQEKAVLFQDS